MTETQLKLIASIQGTVYEALMLSGVTERGLSYVIQTARDKFLGHSLINYVNETIAPIAKQFMQLHKQYNDSEAWKQLPPNFPEVKKYRKLKRMVRWTWRKRPKW